MQRQEPGKDELFPVLFLLDEFASLGKMEILATAVTTLRSYGGRVMIVVQSLSNLKENYGPTGADNFLANTGVQVFMAPSDGETPDYISKAIGDFTRKSRSKSWSTKQFGSTNIQERNEGSRLIQPEQLRMLDDDELVILVQKQQPSLINKIRYYEDRPLRLIFEAQVGNLPEPSPLKPELANKLIFPAIEEVKPDQTESGLGQADGDVSEIDNVVNLANNRQSETEKQAIFRETKSLQGELLSKVKAVREAKLQQTANAENQA